MISFNSSAHLYYFIRFTEVRLYIELEIYNFKPRWTQSVAVLACQTKTDGLITSLEITLTVSNLINIIDYRSIVSFSSLGCIMVNGVPFVPL